MANKKTNREKLIKFLEGTELKIGCYDKNIEKLSSKNFNKVLDGIESGYEALDIEVMVNKEKYIVELFIVDDEVDLKLTSWENYKLQYGNNT